MARESERDGEVNGLGRTLLGALGGLAGCGCLLYILYAVGALCFALLVNLPDLVRSIWNTPTPPLPGGAVWVWAARGFGFLLLAVTLLFLLVIVASPIGAILEEPTRPMREAMLRRVQGFLRPFSMCLSNMASRLREQIGSRTRTLGVRKPGRASARCYLYFRSHGKLIALDGLVKGAIKGAVVGAAFGALTSYPVFATSHPLWWKLLPTLFYGFVGGCIGVVTTEEPAPRHPGTFDCPSGFGIILTGRSTLLLGLALFLGILFGVRAARGPDLRAADLAGSRLAGRDLCRANLRGANLKRANLRGARLMGADLRGADLSNSDLRHADLQQAKLAGDPFRPQLADARLDGANLQGADLRGAELPQKSQRTSFRGADLTAVNLGFKQLPNADLRNARLKGADLQCTQLELANLTGADLEQADLRGADLDRAILRDTNLRGANLANVQFEGVRLEGADLRGVDLRYTPLETAYYDNRTRWPDGFDPQKHGATHLPRRPRR